MPFYQSRVFRNLLANRVQSHVRFQPFNAFLSGFSAAVGQFVLTASLRMQTAERLPPTASAEAKKAAAKKMDGASGEVGEQNGGVSSERAFADFVFGSLILHAFCVNFIN